MLDKKFQAVESKQEQMNETFTKVFDMLSTLNDKVSNIETHTNEELSDTLMAS